MDLREAVALIEGFRANLALRERFADIEAQLHGANASECRDRNAACDITAQLFTAASALKDATAQLHEVIHAVGILLCLPHVLELNESVQGLSLGAGNTGRAADLETNLRVAEFTFIRWRGGSETIRQNKLFKNFFMLAEKQTTKRKTLYVVGEALPRHFLYTSQRRLESVLKEHKVREQFYAATAGEHFETVAQYVAARRRAVEICDVAQWLPELVSQIEDVVLSDSL